MKRFSLGTTFWIRGRRFLGLSGFDGKPLHPPLTDLPVGAYVIAPILDLVGFIGRDNPWGHDLFDAASYTLLAGAIASVLAIVTGLADWLRMRPGSEVRRITNAHFLSMVVVSSLVVADLWLRSRGDYDVTTGGVLALSLAVLVGVTFGAAIGGSLVFDKGYRVRKAPAGQPPPSPEA